MSKEETALANLGPASVKGPTFEDFAKFIGEGFASVDTVVLGDPKETGKQPLYLGMLIGPGEAIQRDDISSGEVRMQPTWAFHPMSKLADGKVGPVLNVTHVVPASFVVHAACARIYKEITEGGHKGESAIVALAFQGQGKTRKGNVLNNFRVFEKYVPKVV
jgi:hypothetical protein